MGELTSAKNTLWHYFSLIAKNTEVHLDLDCRMEIEGIIDDIAEGIISAVKESGDDEAY